MIKINAGAFLTSAALCIGSLAWSSPATAQSGNVSNLVADLYGGDGLLIPGSGTHIGHFVASSEEKLNDLNNIIASSLGGLTFGSTVGAVTFDMEQGVPVRTQESLGPLIAERASTIGRGRINLALSYTFVNYTQLNGTPLNAQTIELTHQDDAGENLYEFDKVRLDLDLKLRQHVLAIAGAYGLTDNLDVGVVVPIVRVEGSVRSVATVIPFSEQTAGFHVFIPEANRFSRNEANATGLGDILLRAKWQAVDPATSRLGVAAFGQFGLPTGDEDDLLGSGSYSAFLMGVVSGSFGRINPHLNLGYEHFFDQPSSIDNDRSNVRGAAGFDLKARDNLSVATDVLARWESDGDKFYDLALGVKWAPKGFVPLSANLVLPLNRNEGLRPDFYFTLGLESTF